MHNLVYNTIGKKQERQERYGKKVMAVRNIRMDDDIILRKKSRAVEIFDEKLFTLLDDMKQTLKKADGVGLAAVQVGILKRVAIVDVGDVDGVMELINPEIIYSEGEQTVSEGCLSLPRRAGVTHRPFMVRLRAQDRYGKWREYEGEDMKARCFCHELDHLDGILFSDRLAPGEKITLRDE